MHGAWVSATALASSAGPDVRVALGDALFQAGHAANAAAEYAASIAQQADQRYLIVRRGDALVLGGDLTAAVPRPWPAVPRSALRSTGSRLPRPTPTPGLSALLVTAAPATVLG